jgi:hypothetical protein
MSGVWDRPARLTVTDLIDKLEVMRSRLGNVDVEIYDADTWETLPLMVVELSATPGSVLIIASSGRDTAGGKRSG